MVEIETIDDLLKKHKGFLEDVIDDLYVKYKKSKGKKEKNEIKLLYEYAVKLDKIRSGFRRYVRL